MACYAYFQELKIYGGEKKTDACRLKLVEGQIDRLQQCDRWGNE